MAAVLGLATTDVEAACREASSDDSVAVPANLNAPDQTGISGDPDAVARAGEACRARGAKRVIPLKVSGAFHSPLMAPAPQRVPGGLLTRIVPNAAVVTLGSADEVEDFLKAA